MSSPGSSPRVGGAARAVFTQKLAPAGAAASSIRGVLGELRGTLSGQGLLDCADVLPVSEAERLDGSVGGANAIGWAASGLMWLTGMPGRAPAVPDGAVLDRAEAAARLFTALSGRLGRRVQPDVAHLLGGRAALMGLRRRGEWSANGSCRLLRAADGWIAVNLARPHDVDAVDALVGALGGQTGPVSADPCPHPVGQVWEALAAAVRTRPTDDVIQVARLLAMPASALRVGHRSDPVRSLPVEGARPAEVSPVRYPVEPVDGRDSWPLVVDLSAMWAGPLCAHLLGKVGMRVVKVESVQRPDGARGGDPAFYDWLHAGHESVALDFATPVGRAMLRRLVDRADVVIESSRPRALAQLGLDAAALVAARPGRVWVSITGYGRTFAATHLVPDPVAFGDDAAVSGGLVAWDRGASGDMRTPVFCADAIADPLTGLFAALAVAASLLVGGGHLLDIPMRDVAAWVAAPPGRGRNGTGGHRPEPWRITGSDLEGWTVHQAGQRQRVLPPQVPWADVGGQESRPPRAALSGADTRAVLETLRLG
jgi:crotonobetainyl-CoA:carnitine CoA-transferase CaiB-like acyl-CoA transferase